MKGNGVYWGHVLDAVRQAALAAAVVAVVWRCRHRLAAVWAAGGLLIMLLAWAAHPNSWLNPLRPPGWLTTLGVSPIEVWRVSAAAAAVCKAVGLALLVAAAFVGRRPAPAPDDG